MRRILLLGFVLFFSITAYAQDLIPCADRPLIADLPRVELRFWCIERAIHETSAGELAFTSIESAPDGTLYAVRPLTGELYVMRDSDADGLPDSPQLAASGMRFPNGLVYAEDALFIIGDGAIYRYAEDTLETIVADLPAGRGFMASGITYADGWLYIGIPMPCDFCESEDELRGTVLKMRLDGSERQVIARGLRYPAGLTVWQGSLWITDTARDGARHVLAADEINRIDLTSEAIPHFGFPYCEGLENVAAFASDFDCSTITLPEISLYSQSTPLAIQPYIGDAFPFLENALLMVLGGSVNNADIRGYQVIYATENDDNQWVIESALPADRIISGRDSVIYDASQGYSPLYASRLNLRGVGVWPHRIFDVAISPEGWVFISVGGGQIFALRPR